MNQRKILDAVAQYQALYLYFEKLLGLDVTNSPIVVEVDTLFKIEGDDLEIKLDEDWYYYTISSESMDGDRLFYKEVDGLFIIDAYPSDSSWDDTSLFILDAKNKL